MAAEPTYEELLQKNIDLERCNNELKKFEASFQAADDGIALLNGEGRFLEVNAKLCSVLGYTREELLQKQPTDLHPSGFQAGFGQIPGLLKERKALPRETICLGKGGSAISLELQTSVMQLNGETVIHVVARDLTSFNQREEILHQYEQIFSLPSQDLMAFVDKNYIYQLVNESYGRAHNKRREELPCNKECKVPKLNDVKMKPKLIALFLFVGIIPLLLVGWWSSQQSADALMHSAFNQLEGIRGVKKYQIENSLKKC